jgi:predicted glutamine amidotransferase
MCELMGLSFERTVSADFSMRAFACRDEENPDGWGLAWYPDRSLAVVKEARTWRESGYSRFLETYPGLRASLYIAHVRSQTTGGPATHADTHPFHRECLGREYCFAHNGTIRDFASLPLDRYHPLGTTDSERLFCHLLDLLFDRGQPLDNPESWRWLWHALSDLNSRGTLNCLMSDGERLFAYRDRHGWKGMAMRKIRFHERTPRVFEDETTGVSVAGDSENRGCLIATHPLSDTGWHAVTLGSLIVLERGALRFSSANPELRG